MEKEKNENTKVEETIMDTANTKETRKKSMYSSKKRMAIVLIFIAIFGIISYIQLRGSYLQYKDLGDNFISVYKTNLIYKYLIMGVNFCALYIIMYFTNRGIKKGLQPFFEKEKMKVPKLPNKSLSLIIATLVSIIVSAVVMQKFMLLINSTSFGIQDSIFNLDISYFVFIKPLIEQLVAYFIILFIGLSLYMALYYVIVFNMYFDGIDGKMIKEGLFLKKISRNAMLIVIGFAILTILNIQNISFGKILTTTNSIDITGAGVIDTTVKLWGYIIFSFVMIIFVHRALKFFKEGNTSRVLKNLAVIPGYLVAMFVVMVVIDLIFVKPNELDKQKKYIAENINNTRDAYNIDIEEKNLKDSGTITQEEVSNNSNVIENIPIITQDVVLTSLEDNQTGTGYFSFRNANLARYEINGINTLVYLSPREIRNSGRTYNNKTYEYTHGMGEIISYASKSTEAGRVEYVQKDISGKDEKINIKQPRIYYGLETNETVATNTKNKKEYDYTDETGTDYTSNYEGEAGLKIGFLDRLILGITKGNMNLAFSGEITNESRILINRNIITRCKKALPYLIYDDNPYTVITKEGKIVWVVDAYTVSKTYPYSQYANIEHDGIKENINYIRNSVKVIIDSYTGEIQFYITDRSDPIAMAYRNIYKDLFVNLDNEIPEDISEHFVYPKFLYNVQADVLKQYHNVKPEVLYRADDMWDLSKHNSLRTLKSSGVYMEPYYTMLRTSMGEEFGLVQMFTPYEKQNIISYLVGTTAGTENKLRLYKFSEDSSIVGPMQLDKQIEQDANIANQLDSLNTTGTKLTKKMIIIPINNTLLYVEPIYQTMLNESEVPILKKIIVASGNKVAIGDNIANALENLLSQYAVDIEVENTDDIEGIIDSIIKANNNLNESKNNKDWEMMGQDIKKLQELISTMEKLKNEEKKKNTENKDDQIEDSNVVENTNISE